MPITLSAKDQMKDPMERVRKASALANEAANELRAAFHLTKEQGSALLEMLLLRHIEEAIVFARNVNTLIRSIEKDAR